MGIESSVTKGLKQLFEHDDGRRLPAAMVERIQTILSYLDAAAVVGELNRPSFHLHPLKGELKDFWAITVRANWRIVFRFGGGRAHDVDFLDYH